MAGVLSTARRNAHISSLFDYVKVVKYGAVVCNHDSIIKRFISHNRSTDYQYLKKGSPPTYHFQKSLPRLPIPKLEDSCENYLRAQTPLLDSNKYSVTESCVNEFLKCDGIKCQNALIKEDKRNPHTSYISQPWFDMYLCDRKPLPINFNPFLVFVNATSPMYNQQLVRATNLTISSLRFLRTLGKEYLEPEIYHLNAEKSDTPLFRNVTRMLPKPISWYGAYLFKAYPLDMSQYKNLFNTTRVPEVNKDRIKYVPGKKHMLVMRRGHFYVFDVLDKNGEIVRPDVILSSIEKILQSDIPVAEHPVGILTTEDRNTWAQARKHLEDLGNTEILDLIDSSIFNLVLDDESTGDDSVRIVTQFLHANGVNRWFDKSVSLIITSDGVAGLNFEHSWGDGVAVLRYFNEIYKDSVENPKIHKGSLRSWKPPVRKLEFVLDDQIKTTIANAKQKYDATCQSLEVRLLNFIKFGRKLCRVRKVSPDALMQLSFQMAYDLLEQKQVATYESCSTAAFKHGRTETVRPCTIETQDFCRALRQSPTLGDKQLTNMIRKCSEVHSRLIKEAAMGKGFDRHLFALKLKADELGLKPDIFNDPAYAAINHNIISTSTLTSDHLLFGAFGPVVQDGFGIAYSMWSDRIGYIVTNYKDHSDGARFVESLGLSLNKLYDILKSDWDF